MKVQLGLNNEKTVDVELDFDQWIDMFSTALWQGQPILWIAIQKSDGSPDRINFEPARVDQKL